jgi:hypothetical protein
VSKNQITIDTNVFEHLFNPQNNPGDHIDILLRHLFQNRFTLCVDNKDRISGEYKNRLTPLFKRTDDHPQKVSLLRYFVLYAERRKEAVDFGDALMVAIKGTVRLTETTDRVFVYVAIFTDSILVSNDLAHITNHRAKLRQCARNHRRKVTDFVSSADALAAMDG